MLLSELLLDLSEIYEEFGDMPCNFDRKVYNHVSSETSNVQVFVQSNTDNPKEPVQHRLSMYGI